MHFYMQNTGASFDGNALTRFHLKSARRYSSDLQNKPEWEKWHPDTSKTQEVNRFCGEVGVVNLSPKISFVTYWRRKVCSANFTRFERFLALYHVGLAYSTFSNITYYICTPPFSNDPFSMYQHHNVTLYDNLKNFYSAKFSTKCPFEEMFIRSNVFSTNRHSIKCYRFSFEMYFGRMTFSRMNFSRITFSRKYVWSNGHFVECIYDRNYI